MTILQLYVQGAGRLYVPSQIMSMLPYLATIALLTVIASWTVAQPARRAGLSWQAVQSASLRHRARSARLQPEETRRCCAT